MKTLIKKIIPSFIISWYHFGLAFSGALIYGFPSRKIRLIGITGTNGKTTVSEMALKVLEKGGYSVSLVNSIRFKIGDREKPNLLKMTMPGRFKIQKFIRQAVAAKSQYLILEVTSEGIKQHRHRFIKFHLALLTNLSPEHIEAHGSFEKYRQAKAKLFQKTRKIHILNYDDKATDYFRQFPAEKKYTYGLNQGDVNNQNLHLKLLLPGDFNIYNALAAICIGRSQGIDLSVGQQAVESIKGIPGRMEEVISHSFKVIVDYAVTPDALENLYQNLKRRPATRSLIAVFGSCGGGRDKWRRPALGKIAARYCRRIIITNEDPYDEDPDEIINQIAQGIDESQLSEKNLSVSKIPDRRKAISAALKSAEEGDIVVITGKGCEPWICLAKGKKIKWDDRRVVREEYDKLKTNF